MRRRGRLVSKPEEELRVAMIAAASRPDLDEWATFAGEWMAEIAFEVTDNLAGQKLLGKVRRLIQLEPALARHCATAEAALSSFAA